MVVGTRTAGEVDGKKWLGMESILRVKPNRLQLMGCRKPKKAVRMSLTVLGFNKWMDGDVLY